MYDSYKNLVGRPYKSGQDDCYGLCRAYYAQVFNLVLTDFARPDEWWMSSDLDLVNDFFELDGWENIGTNFRNLQVGDALVFALAGSRANHVGVYVGNGMFIHHVYQRMSAEESLAQKWKTRCLMVVRHAAITEALKANTTKVTLEEIREHVKP